MQSPPPPPLRNPAVVPFSWEEKPGVPKKQESSALILSILISPPSPSPSPLQLQQALSIPPCLQRPPLRKTNSFAHIPSPAAPLRASAGVLVRKQSFDSRLLYHAHPCSSASRSSKQGPHTLHCRHRRSAEQGLQEKQRLRRWLEEDPFFMAIEVCRQESARLSCDRRRQADALTIRQLQVPGFQDECLQGTAQKQPLIARKKQPGALCKFLAKCLAC